MHVISVEIERATAERLIQQLNRLLEEQPSPDLAELVRELATGLDEDY